MDPRIIYTIAFSHISAVGTATFRRLENYFPTLYEAWHASVSEYARAGISNKTSEKIISERNKINIEGILDILEREQVRVVTTHEEGYPVLLGQIHDPPFILYFRGILPQKERVLFGIVGPRKASSYGLQCTHQLVPDLVRQGVGIVSGLAYGIDAASHEAALAHNGYTVAVLGGGVDHRTIYPPVHRNLAERIAANGGCVMSEYPPSMPPRKHHFPLRNRIIAGICKGVLIVEAAAKSGALITATCALENGREVCAVPGPISSPTSVGTNRLLKHGAHVVTESEDILSILGFDTEKHITPASQLAALSETEQKIYTALSDEPMHIDELVSSLALDTQVVASTLLLLEMKNLVRSYERMQYGRV